MVAGPPRIAVSSKVTCFGRKPPELIKRQCAPEGHRKFRFAAHLWCPCRGTPRFFDGSGGLRRPATIDRTSGASILQSAPSSKESLAAMTILNLL